MGTSEERRRLLVWKKFKLCNRRDRGEVWWGRNESYVLTDYAGDTSAMAILTGGVPKWEQGDKDDTNDGGDGDDDNDEYLKLSITNFRDDKVS